MKIISYTLAQDGTVPEYVVDGGYFATPSNLPSPQDWQLVGWANDQATEPEILDLKAHLLSIGADEWTDLQGNPIDLDELVTQFQS